ncbi:MAG: pyridoxine 5'-phosphate synthase [Sphingobacteriales bacterium]|nr:MAG: pyridoxine 5'-phosphate synthase [Sphingobacteriales bacterium]
MHPRLSVNINKIATLRNARGGNMPDIIKAAKDCERFGAEGITVHPRPDERHIRYADVIQLKDVVSTEFNIEGYPTKDFLELVFKVKPEQCTLVPDAENVITSNQGWDTIKQKEFLSDIIEQLQSSGIRVSLFVDPIEQFIEGAKSINADCIELYTGSFAHIFYSDKHKAIEPYIQSAKYAQSIGLATNAGHDLNLDNIAFFKKNIPFISEVSIGHALICDALYYGLENTIQMYLRQLK